jgi:hypothetical protein
MSTLRTHFTFRVDTWTPDGESIVEHVAGVEDYHSCRTFREVKKAPASLYRGFKCVSIGKV